MILRIEQIKRFGIFADFAWDGASTADFRKYNLLYGWNYSGKTTISRVFGSAERRELPDDYRSGSFRLRLEDDTLADSSSLPSDLSVRVFNRDFIDSNFEQEHRAPAVFIVGEENIKRKNRLIQLRRRKDRVDAIAQDLVDKLSSAQRDISTGGTSKAREIGEILGDRNFRRPKLESRVAEISDGPTKCRLPDGRVDALLATIRSGDQFDKVANVTGPNFKLADEARKVEELLQRTASNRVIQRLKEDRVVERWVREGRAIHEGKIRCEFCGGELTTNRIEALAGHFSEEYEALAEELKQAQTQLEASSFDATLPDESRLLPECRDAYTTAAKEFAAWRTWAEAIVKKLLEAIALKQDAMESALELDLDLARDTEGAKAIERVNEAIEGHNTKIRGMDQTKAEAKTALEQHYAAVHISGFELPEKQKRIADLTTDSERAKKIARRIEGMITDIEVETRQSSIAATRLNELLTSLLGGEHVQAASVGDSEFEFRRGDTPARNLSDGERTAIAFAYFLISLEDGGMDIQNLTIFVDDPVSSLDSNHIYAVYALICERLGGCHQLFVSTHNSEFLNLMKDAWLSQRSKLRKHSSGYLVARSVTDDGTATGTICDLPKLLLKNKSEYQFVFSHLHAFAQSDGPSLHEAYTAPNLLRKFLEAYLGFRIPIASSWADKLHLLLDSSDTRREIKKFADDASHLQNLTRAIEHPQYVASAQQNVRTVLDALKERDKQHYEALVDACTEGGTT